MDGTLLRFAPAFRKRPTQPFCPASPPASKKTSYLPMASKRQGPDRNNQVPICVYPPNPSFHSASCNPDFCLTPPVDSELGLVFPDLQGPRRLRALFVSRRWGHLKVNFQWTELMAAASSRNRKRFLAGYDLDEDYLVAPDGILGRPGLLRGLSPEGLTVLVKLWPLERLPGY